jgi:glycosyltransferase involved in cell wall biosynthesis
MKVCYANPTVLMKRPISELVARRAGAGAETSIFLPKPLFGRIDASLHHSALIKGQRIYAYGTVNVPFLRAEQPLPVTPTFYLDLIRIWRRHDVVHAWVPFYASSTLLALTKLLFFRKKRLIITMDTVPGYSFSMGRLDPLLKLYYATVGKLVFRACDVITLYGESFMPFAEAAGIPREKISITPTGIEDPPRGRGTDIRAELRVPHMEKIVLFVGLLVPRKGLDTLLATAEKLKAEGITFVVIGDGPSRRAYERRARERGLKVRFTGFRRDVHRFYAWADAFFFPSRGEGLAGAIMEAMSHGLPVVANDIPGTRDLIADGTSGFLCPDESDAYSDRLLAVLRDARLARRLGANARRAIRGKYSWAKNARRFEELY